MGRTRDVSKILTSNTSILSLASASSIYQTIEKTGLVELTPSTISVTGGSGSISATGSVSFTSASAISLNGVFSATYDTYRIFYNTTHSVDSGTTLRLRASGTDASTTAYEWQRLRATSSTVSTTYAGSQTSFDVIVNASGTSLQLGQITLFDPFKASASYLTLDSTYCVNSASIGQIGGRHNVSTSYDGFTLLVNAGNMTGSVSIFGVNK
jgi:hypothetical protein